MGSCLTGQRQKSNLQFFRKDINLVDKTQLYQPLTSTLFNTMRKLSDIVLIFIDSLKAKQYNTSTFDEFRLMPAKSLKMLYSFKKLIIIGQYKKIQAQISQLAKLVSLSCIQIVDQKAFQKFLKQFPIFCPPLAPISPSQLPLLVFDSDQLIQTPSKPLLIFIHFVQQKQKNIYQKLRIIQNSIIYPSQQDDKDGQEFYYLEKLKKIKGGRVALIHNKMLNQNMIMEILAKYLIYLYQIPEISAKRYLSRSLPNATIINLDERVPIASEKVMEKNLSTQTRILSIQGSKSQKRLSHQVQRNDQKLCRLFKSHSIQLSKPQTQRAYSLLSKLISNIINNQSSQQYRKVKSTNRQMQELLTRNQSGKQLLNQLGFHSKDNLWVNNLEAKYLKVIRADLDLAYRNSSQLQ